MSRAGWLLAAAVQTIAVAGTALPPASPLDAINYSRRYWQSQDGLPEDFAQSIAQTRDGYLWVGTSGGLVRFDGVRFSLFSPATEPALRDDSIYALLAASDGSLWIGTEGGGLARYRNGKFRAYGAGQGLSNGFVRVIYEDRSCSLWVGTDRGLFRLQGESLVRVDGKDGIPSLSVHTICEDRAGRLLVGGAGILVLAPNERTYYRSAGNFADNAVRAIKLDAGGALWIGTVSGLRRLERGIQGDPFLAPKLLDNVNISVMGGTLHGAFWIGTYGHGLLRDQGGRMIRIGAPLDLPHGNVLAIQTDREGDIWVGTQGGLLRMSPSVARTITTPDGVSQSMNTVYQDPAGKLLVTSLSGRLFEVHDKSLVPFDLPAALRGLPVRNAFRARDGALWLGTDGRGVVRLAGRAASRYTMNEGLVNDFVRAFCEDRQGNLWIGTDGGLSRWRGGRFENFDADSGLAYGSIRALAEDRQGSLWIGTDGGLSRYRDGAFTSDGALEPLRGRKIWALFEDPEGSLWIGTHGAGLFLLDQGRLYRFGPQEGIPAKVHFMVEDRRGELWLSSSAGIFSVSRSALRQSSKEAGRPLAVRLYGTSDGLSTNQMNGGVQSAGALSAAGELWFPSTKGVVALSPGSSRAGEPPQVILERVLADDRAVPLGGVIRLRPGRGKLELEYTAIRLRSPERLRFSYWMEGLEREWTGAGQRRVAYYTNLPPGAYRFHVAAYDVDDPGRVAEEVAEIFWQAPFYRTWWFLALGGLTAAGLVWSAYQLHVRSVRKRFAAVLEERNRLAREMHDTVIQGCVGVSALLEAASSAREVSPQVSAAMLEHARDEIRTTVEDARSAVWNLRQSAGAEDIAGAIARLADRVSRESGIPVELRTSGVPLAMGAEAERGLLLGVREALQNAVRHASPSHVVVALDFAGRQVRVEVGDDGIGFVWSPAALPAGRHYGLIGMRERVEKLGGRFDLTSSPGAGTTVRFTLPANEAGSGHQ